MASHYIVHVQCTILIKVKVTITCGYYLDLTILKGQCVGIVYT